MDDALSRLEQRDPRMAEVVMLRYYAELTQEETAQALGISRRTVNRLSVAARVGRSRPDQGARAGHCPG